MFIKKFISSGSKAILNRSFQTVRSLEPEVRVVGSLLTHPIPKEKDGGLSKEAKLANILEEVKAVDSLPRNPSHIEHLVGRATKGRIYQKQGIQEENILDNNLGFLNKEKYEVGGIDIAEKTQLILQSPHPVRYVIEKEIYNSQKGLRLRLPSYHTWIMLFGRSLLNRYQLVNDPSYNTILNNIANASDSGMFSADIHNTILDVSEDHSAFKNCSGQYHMGNKYAVLVGDYFAIRCIYHAERTKTNSVMVAITEGVEEFTTSSFGTNLFDEDVGYPQMLSRNASVHDWILYNQKAFGYLKGGLYAALSLHYKPRMETQKFDLEMAKFVGNLSVFLKACGELEALERSESQVNSPFLLGSLPAILCQIENPQVFNSLRKKGYELDGECIGEMHDIIRRSSLTNKRTRNFILGFAAETKQAFHRISKDEYYKHIFDSLIDVVAEES